jgi:hypothetical protein
VRARCIVQLVLLAVAITASAAVAGSDRTSGVTSSLDGKTVLPERSRWVVHPGMNASSVREVDYLVDGKLRWVEHDAPYYFGGDDNGADPGYLVTSWLDAGRHLFTSRVVSVDGKVATDVVNARVRKTARPPARLAGMWTRIVTKRDQTKASVAFGAAGGNVPPAGVWRLVFDRIGAWELDPANTGLVTEYAIAGDVVHAYAPISMMPCSDTGPCGVKRFGHHHIGGVDCTAAGPFGTYRWSISQSQLTLIAIHEPCGQRRVIWEGTWRRLR